MRQLVDVGGWMFTGPVEDRAAIRDLIDSYTDAVHQRNPVQWADTWTDDAVWNLGGDDVSGKANVVGAWKQAMDNFSFVSFAASPGMIHVYGASADVRVYTQEFLIDKNGQEIRIHGQYDDRLVKEAGRWRFKSRRYTILRRA
jgi:uncharacterized protein (TIGR02246 family)